MKKVLVTGASGFIGRHCLQGLVDRGYEVHAATIGEPPEGIKGVRWYSVNLLEKGEAAALVGKLRPTHLLHCAWFVVPGKLITSPENFLWVEASLELLRAFADNGGSRVVTSGSGYEYDWRYGYCTESVTPCLPDTVYGRCKLSLGELAASFAGSRGLSNGWARIFFLYGPHEHPDRLVSSIIRSLLRKELARTSHGLQVRDYLHVQDVADGLVGLLDSAVEGPVNIASGQPVAIREIVMQIGKMMGAEELLQIGALPARANDAPFVVADVRRLTAEVGWTQRWTLQAGLEQTIEWWRTRNH